MNKAQIQKLRDDIVLQIIKRGRSKFTPSPLQNFSWSWHEVERAALKPEIARAVFPGGLADAIAHFADLMDRRMLAALPKKTWDDLKIRQRIRAAVLARLAALQEFKDAERAALAYWALPLNKLRGLQILWRTADRIWQRAGDTSTDYNYYTKRGLLSGVLAATTLAWLEENDPHLRATQAFLDRRIENVMELGKIIGRFKIREAA